LDLYNIKLIDTSAVSNTNFPASMFSSQQHSAFSNQQGQSQDRQWQGRILTLQYCRCFLGYT